MMMLRLSRRSTRGRDAVSLIAMAGMLVAAAGCSSTGPKSGSLAVTITAPAGVTPAVTVAGGNNYSKTIAATTTLTGLAPGSYTVTAANVASSNAIVGTMNTAVVSGSPVTVSAGGSPAMASATYTARAGSGGMWVANFGATHTLAQYTAAQLGASSSVAAATAIAFATQSMFETFDANGNLWMSTWTGQTIVEYSASQLAASGTPTPAVILTSNAGSLAATGGLAFDANGNLWVATANTLVEFTPSQLASSGDPTPAVTISASAGSLSNPIPIAFDASGNLWVGNTSNTIVEFTPSQLSATGAPTPTVTVTAVSNSIVGPLAMAFDPTGNLWVANGNNSQNTVVEFSKSQLAASGTPTPAVTLSANAGSLSNPAGLAFDATGNLWVSNASGATGIEEFTASQIVASGSPAPTTAITSASLSEPFGIAFNPHATNLPIKP